MAKRKLRKKLKPQKLTPAQQALKSEQRSFRARIRNVFNTAGFKNVLTRGKEFTFKGQTSEFDGLYVFENIVVITEDTCGNSDSTKTHLNKKHYFYDLICKNKECFIKFLKSEFEDFREAIDNRYSDSDIKLLISYCSKHRIDDEAKEKYPRVVFMEDRHLQYFSTLARTVGGTVKFELFKFFNLSTEDISLSPGSTGKKYNGFILPESPSGFPEGFKVATFYIDPKTLMSLAYVLRKDGWQQGDDLYQRMISRHKLQSMRQYLSNKNRVFINNVIVSLPSSTRVTDQKTRKTIDFESISKTTPIEIEVPIQFNSIGIIDGQHRVFAYHEGTDNFEKVIAPKREKQQLLVTGVIYPDTVTEEEQRQFEAQLFLEINDKQTKTRPDLRQAIEAIVNPFSVISISRAIITKLAASGPLCGYIEEHQFDHGKLKSSSIVSYGLKHIVKCEGDDSLFKIWNHADKDTFAELVKKASSGTILKPISDRKALEEYVEFCSTEIRNILVGYKLSVPALEWTLDRKNSRALSATAINGVIFALRRLLQEDKTTDLEGYKNAFKKFSQEFAPKKFRFKSSHWRAFGDKIVEEAFS